MLDSDRIENIRVMTYNIHHGEGTDGEIDIARIARVILDAQVDVVCLQEVDCGVRRSGQVDTMAELAQQTGMRGVFGRNLDYQGGGYGNGVLTRFPVLANANHHYQMIRPNEQRGLMHMRLAVNGLEFAILNTHVDYRPDDAERLMNIVEIEQVADAYDPCPVIVCGDFNALPHTRTTQEMRSRFRDAWELVGQGTGFTFPAVTPDRRIDYVFFREGATEFRLVPHDAHVLPSAASDHLPLVVDLKPC